jgi:hypothetical protein
LLPRQQRRAKCKYALLDDVIRDSFQQTLQGRLSHTGTRQEHLCSLFLAVTDHLSGIQTRCQRSYQMFESLVEAQIKLQLREHVRAWLEQQPSLRAQPSKRLDLAATLTSWSIYGAAREWQKYADTQPAEAFAAEALPLIAATVTALGH